MPTLDDLHKLLAKQSKQLDNLNRKVSALMAKATEAAEAEHLLSVARVAKELGLTKRVVLARLSEHGAKVPGLCKQLPNKQWRVNINLFKQVA